MFNSKNIRTIKPDNCYNKPFIQTVSIRDNSCDFIIKDALFTKECNKEVLLDEDCIKAMIMDMSKAIKVNSSKYNKIPKNIVISRGGKNSNIDNTNNSKDNSSYISYKVPNWKFEDVYVDQSSKDHIKSSLALLKHKEKLFKEWGLEDTLKKPRCIALNFYGPPGTGKSMMAEAVASYLNKKIYVINYAQLESKYVGETPKNIIKAFEIAKKENAVLVFDEADSFLGQRLTNVSQSADYGVNVTRSVMLMEIEKFEGVIIFTTNLLCNYDEAFKRRILANVEFKLPDEQGRKSIWKVHIPSKMPLHDSLNIDLIASKYVGLSGADIKDMLLYASVIAVDKNKESIFEEDFDMAYKYIKERYNNKNIKITNETITQEQYNKEMNAIENEG